MTTLKVVCPGYSLDGIIHRCGTVISKQETKEADWHDQNNMPLVVATFEKCEECLEIVSRETSDD